MDRIEGIPEGYRLGNVVSTQGGGLGDGSYAVVELIPEQPKQLEAVIVDNPKPVAWMFRELINKHMTGELRPGEIQMGEMKGIPSSAFALSFREPNGYIVEKIPLYSHPDQVTIREREKGNG